MDDIFGKMEKFYDTEAKRRGKPTHSQVRAAKELEQQRVKRDEAIADAQVNPSMTSRAAAAISERVSNIDPTNIPSMAMAGINIGRDLVGLTEEQPKDEFSAEVLRIQKQLLMDERKEQREYVKNADKAMVDKTREILKYTTDYSNRHGMMEEFGKLSPEQQTEVMKLAPGVMQELGDERGNIAMRALNAIWKGTNDTFINPVYEGVGQLTGMGLSPEQIEQARYIEGLRQQDAGPIRSDDPWYVSGPLAAAEMLPFAAVTSRLGGRFGNAGKALGQGLGGSARAVSALEKAGQLSGITAASFPTMYVGEYHALKDMGMEDNAGMRATAALSGLVGSLIEGIVPDPFPGGNVSLNRGAVTAARQYLTEAVKKFPGELSEEGFQGLSSGLFQTMASWADENIEDRELSDAFKNGLEQSLDSALPLAFMMGVPAAGRAGLAGAKAQVNRSKMDKWARGMSPTQAEAFADRLSALKSLKDKKFVSEEEAQTFGITGETRKERMSNLDEQVASLTRAIDIYEKNKGDSPEQPSPEVDAAMAEGSPGLAGSSMSDQELIGLIDEIDADLNTLNPKGEDDGVQQQGQQDEQGNEAEQQDEPQGQGGQVQQQGQMQDQGQIEQSEQDELTRLLGDAVEGDTAGAPDAVVDPFGEAGDAGPAATQVQPGDRVQWTSNGVDQFTEPRKVIKTDTFKGQEFVQIEGSSAWIPASEATVIQKAEKEAPQQETPAPKPGATSWTPPTINKKDQFGKNVQPKTLEFRQDFVNKAKPGARFTHSSYEGSEFEVGSNGDLYEINSMRKMGNVERMANVLKPEQNITWTRQADVTTAEVDSDSKPADAVESVQSTDGKAEQKSTAGKTPLPQVGEPTRLMGKDFKRVDVIDDENGMRYELFENDGGEAATRTTDLGSGSVSDLRTYPTREAARKRFGEIPGVKAWEQASVPAESKSEPDVIEIYKKDPELAALFESDAGVREGYTVEGHTRTVLSNWRKQVTPGNVKEIGSRAGSERMQELMEHVVALHDIGKPIAIKEGDKSKQHSKTLPILEKNLKAQGFSQKEVAIARTLVGNDVIGQLIQGKISAAAAANSLAKLSEQAGLSEADYFTLQASLYKADASSYPSLAGSIFSEGPSGKLALPDVNFGILEERFYGQVYEAPWSERVGPKGKGYEGGGLDRGGVGGRYVHGSAINFDSYDESKDSGKNRVGKGLYLVDQADSDVASHYAIRSIKRILTGAGFKKPLIDKIMKLPIESLKKGQDKLLKQVNEFRKNGDVKQAERHAVAAEVLGEMISGRIGEYVLPVDFSPKNVFEMGANDSGGRVLSQLEVDQILGAVPAEIREKIIASLKDKPRAFRFYDAMAKELGSRDAATKAIQDAGYDAIQFVHVKGGYKRPYNVMVSLNPDKAAIGNNQPPSKAGQKKDDSAAVLRKFGLVANESNGEIYLQGNTYEWKEIIKEAGQARGGQYKGEFAWRLTKEGFESLLGELRRLPVPDGGFVGSAPDNVSDPKIRRLREDIDGRPDERKSPEYLRGIVSEGTKRLIESGIDIGIPQVILDEQVEDVGMIVDANNRGESMFLLANEPGSGKTFVLGGAIRELREAGAKRFVYVTLRKELIDQIKSDLSNYGIDDVEFITYSSMRDMAKNPPSESDVLIFDEAHSVKNNESNQGESASEWMNRAKFTIFASATPFENPTQAEYLAPTGVFDEFGGYKQFALAFGARSRSVGGNLYVYWERSEDSDEDSKAAQNYFAKRGMITNRRILLPENQVDSRMVKMEADQKHVDQYTYLTDVAERSQVSGFGKAWIVNLRKRMLEDAKMQQAVNEAQAALDRGRFPIIFVETKEKRSHNIPDLVERERAYQRAIAMTMPGDIRPKRSEFGLPPAGVVEILESYMIASGNETIEIASPLDFVRKKFGKKLAVFTGTRKGSVTSASAKKDLEAWRNGSKPVLLATMKKGGTGLSLHDKVGDHPTTQINVNLPWTPTEIVQVAQRSARYGLVGKAEIMWLFSENIPFDRDLGRRVGGRMADMGAVVHGQDVADADRLQDWDFESQPFSVDQDGKVEVQPELEKPSEPDQPEGQEEQMHYPDGSAYKKWMSRRHRIGDKPTSFLSGHSSKNVREAAKQNPGLGLVITPRSKQYVKHGGDYSHIMIDNGAFSEFTGTAPFSEKAFFDLLDAVVAAGLKDKVQFVVVPDKVGDWVGTTERWNEFKDRVREYGMPLAYVGQDGIEQNTDKIPWDEFDVFFIGGSTPWKIGYDPKGEYKNINRPTDAELMKAGWLKEQQDLVQEAKRRGKRVHMGRVNSWKRIDIANYGMQVESVDGNFIGAAPNKNLPVVLGWLRDTGGDMFKEVSQEGVAEDTLSDEAKGRLDRAGVTVAKTKSGWTVKGLPDWIAHEIASQRRGKKVRGGYNFKESPIGILEEESQRIEDESREVAAAEATGNVRTRIGTLSPELAEQYESSRSEMIEARLAPIRDQYENIDTLLSQFVPKHKRGQFKLDLIRKNERQDADKVKNWDKFVQFSRDNPNLGLPTDSSDLLELLINTPFGQDFAEIEFQIAEDVDAELFDVIADYIRQEFDQMDMSWDQFVDEVAERDAAAEAEIQAQADREAQDDQQAADVEFDLFGNEVKIKREPKPSNIEPDDRSQGSLFEFRGAPGQMSIFPEAGVPDDMVAVPDSDPMEAVRAEQIRQAERRRELARLADEVKVHFKTQETSLADKIAEWAAGNAEAPSRMVGNKSGNVWKAKVGGRDAGLDAANRKAESLAKKRDRIYTVVTVRDSGDVPQFHFIVESNVSSNASASNTPFFAYDYYLGQEFPDSSRMHYDPEVFKPEAIAKKELESDIKDAPDALYQSDAKQANADLLKTTAEIVRKAKTAGITTFDELVAMSVKVNGVNLTRSIGKYLQFAAEKVGISGARPVAEIIGEPRITKRQAVSAIAMAFPSYTDEQIAAFEQMFDITGIGRDAIDFAHAGTPIPSGGIMQSREPVQVPLNIARELTQKELDGIRASTVRDIVAHFQSFPSKAEFEEAAKAGAAKRGWYRRAAEALESLFGADSGQFVRLLASTSPRQGVSNNLQMTLQIWNAWNIAGRPTSSQEIMEILEKIPGATFNSRVKNVIRSLQGYEDISGYKVTAFAKNLLGNYEAVTNDAWMAAFAGIDPKVFGTKAGYLAFTAKVRQTARALEMTPAEVQETIWAFTKTLAALKTGGRTSSEALAGMTHESVASMPEFAQLITEDGNVKKLLTELGLGEVVERIAREQAKSRSENRGRIQSDRRRILERIARRVPGGAGGRGAPGAVQNAAIETDDGTKWFSERAMESAREEAAGKSRTTIVTMSVDDFLKMAEQLDQPVASKAETVKNVLDKGEVFSDIPYLSFTHDGKGAAKVISHEGRHRAMAIKARGGTSIPVRLHSSGNNAIRWSQQSAKSFDRIKGEWPQVLSGQTDGEIAFPIQDPAAIDVLLQESAGGLPREASPSLVEPELAKKLDAGEKVTLYRAMSLIDGKLYPPMSAKMPDAEGKLSLREPEQIGQWMRSEERPDLVPEKGPNAGKFPLKKPGGGTTWALYAPYFHASPIPLNDQFTSAWKNDGVERPQLVTVEVEVPVSEITEQYQAKGSSKKTGANKWNSGVVASKVPGGREVVLSRYIRIKRIVPDSEVAQKIAEIVNRNRIAIPENTVTPQLRAELEKQGVRIAPAGTAGDDILYQESPRLTKKDLKNVNWSRLRELGTTTDPNEAGYIKPDGTLADLSGKREGGSPGTRSYDHREAGGTAGMQEVIAYGWVRMDENAGTLDIAKMPTIQQVSSITKMAGRHNGELVVDLEDGLGEYSESDGYYRQARRRWSQQYPAGTSPQRIVNDIKKFFGGGTPNTLYQESPRWHSKAISVVQDKMGSKASPDQILAMLKNNGVKEEEIQYSGLADLLGTQKSISKEDVIDLLENGIKVSESTLPRRTPESDAIDRLQSKGIVIDFDMNGEFNGFVRQDTMEHIDESEFDDMTTDVLDDIDTLMNSPDINLGNTKYGTSQLTIPNGKNYREVLIKLPVGKEGAYKSTHWDDANVVVHLRTNERIDADGKRVLFIEELQSDWHQEGRRRGYRSKARTLEEIDKDLQSVMNELKSMPGVSETPTDADWVNHPEITARFDALSEERSRANSPSRMIEQVPDAPFKKSWPMLGMKWAIQYASENGFDRIAWTTGEQQAVRAGQAQEISWVNVSRAGDGKYNVIAYHKGMIVNEKAEMPRVMTKSQIESFLGKEFAEQVEEEMIPVDTSDWKAVKNGRGWIVRDETGTIIDPNMMASSAQEAIAEAATIFAGREKQYRHVPKTIGGIGMRKFYDEMLPNNIGKFIKTFGGSIGSTTINQSDGVQSVQPSFDITPQMRQSAIEVGQPLFQTQRQANGDDVKGWIKFVSATRAVIGGTSKADVSTFIHEFGHAVRRFLLNKSVPVSDRAGITDEEIDKLESHIGVTDGMWERKHEERFAKLWEQYWFEGKSPNSVLDAMFQKIAAWMRDVYRSIREISGAPLHPDVRELFDKLVQRGLPDGLRPPKQSNVPVPPPFNSAAHPEYRERIAPDGYEFTALGRSIMDYLRKNAGASLLEDAEPETIKEWVKQAEITLAQDPNAAIRLLNEIKSSPGRAIDHHEAMLLSFHYRHLANLEDLAFQEQLDAVESGDPERISRARTEFIRARMPMTEFEELVHTSKSTWGRTGVALQIMLRKDFSAEGLMRRAQHSNHGKPLSDDQAKEMRSLAKKIEKLQKEADAATARAERAEAELASIKQHDEVIRDTTPRPRRVPPSPPTASGSPKKSVPKTELDEAWENLSKKVGGINLLFQESNPFEAVVMRYRELGVDTFAELERHVIERVGKSQASSLRNEFREAWKATSPDIDIAGVFNKSDASAMTRLARQIQRRLVEGGMTDRNEIIDAVAAEMSQILEVEFTRIEAMDALSKYGQFSVPNKDTVETLIRRLNAETLKERQIIQLQTALDRADQLREMNNSITDEEIGDILVREDILVKPTGPQRDQAWPDLRKMQRTYNELKSKIPASTESREGMLQTTLGAIERRLANRIFDLKEAIEKSQRINNERKSPPSNPRIDQMRAEVEQLTKEYRAKFPPYRAKMTEQQRIANAIKAAQRTIQGLERQIQTRDFDKPKTVKVWSPELEALNAEKASLRSHIEALQAMEMQQWESEGGAVLPDKSEIARRKAYIASLDARTAKYKKMLADKDFEPKKKEQRQFTKEEIDARRRLRDAKLEALRAMAKYHISKLKGMKWAADKLSEFMHLSRAMKTSLDMSALLNQGALPSLGRPLMAMKVLTSVLSSMKYAFKKERIGNRDALTTETIDEFLTGIDSAAAEFELMEHLTTGEWAEFRLKAGLQITSTDSELSKQEEMFQGRWGKYVPGVTLSGRVYTMMINKMRADLFDLIANSASIQGTPTLEEAKAIASYVNVATGRSDLKGVPILEAFEKHAGVLNVLFFAPRYVASRFQYLAMPFYLAGSNNSLRVKKAIAVEYARTMLGYSTVMGVAALTGLMFWDWDDEERPSVNVSDSTSSDFGKIKFGDTRIDVAGGILQSIVFASRMIQGRIKDRQFNEGGINSINRASVLYDFMRSKFSPVAGLIATGLHDWEDVVGNKKTDILGLEVHPSIATTADLIVPLSGSSMYEAIKDHGWPGLFLAAGAFLGVRTSTYGDKTRYLNGNEQDRQKLMDRYLRNMQWNSKPPRFSEYLTPDQQMQIEDRREEKKQSLVNDALYKPNRKNFSSDAAYEAAVEKRQTAISAVIDAGWSGDEMRQMVMAQWKRMYGSPYEFRGGRRQLKKAVVERLREVNKVIGGLAPQ